jgi:hypothetical protein
MSCRTTIKRILSGLPAPAVRPFGATGLAGAKLGWPGATSTGRCKSAEVRQLSTTSLTQVRLHISGDNTPPPSKKCRRNSLYSAEACGPPRPCAGGPGYRRFARVFGAARIPALKQQRYAGSANCTT